MCKKLHFTINFNFNNQLINQSINQSINQLINQSIYSESKIMIIKKIQHKIHFFIKST